jgi:hypothetical protein
LSPTGRCRLRDASAGDLARSVPLADQGVRSRLLPCQTQSAVTWRGGRSTVQPGAKPACRKPARTSAEDSDLRAAADQARQQDRRAERLGVRLSRALRTVVSSDHSREGCCESGNGRAARSRSTQPCANRPRVMSHPTVVSGVPADLYLATMLTIGVRWCSCVIRPLCLSVLPGPLRGRRSSAAPLTGRQASVKRIALAGCGLGRREYESTEGWSCRDSCRSGESRDRDILTQSALPIRISQNLNINDWNGCH